MDGAASHTRTIGGVEFFRRRWPEVFTFGFFLLALLGAWCHELWRDELQSWMFARDSASPLELLKNLRYDGHPALWHMMLWILSRFVDHPAAMQGLHAVLAAAGCWILLRYAPFHPIERMAAALGYFTAYEYAVISRPYVLAVVLLFLFCRLYADRDRAPLRLGLVLFLLANASVFGLIFAVGGALVWSIDRFASEETSSGGRSRFLAALGLSALGTALSVWKIVPPVDYGLPMILDWSLSAARVQSVFGLLVEAYAPIPGVSRVDLWNTHLISSTLGSATYLVGGVVFAAGCLATLRTRRGIACYLILTLGCLAFFYLNRERYVFARHVGHLTLALFAALWLSRSADTMRTVAAAPRIERAGAITERWLFRLVLVAQLAGAVMIWIAEFRHPFSNASDVVRYLRQEGRLDAELIGATDYHVSSIAGLTGKPVYYLDRGEPGSFILFDRNRLRGPGRIQAVALAVERVRSTRRDAILILSADRYVEGEAVPSFQDVRIDPPVYFDRPCLCGDERFQVFRIAYRGP